MGLYWHQYGQSSFYFNVIGGEITIKQKRTGGLLSDRSGESKGHFMMYGLGYHWFWDNFNLRLGLAAGTMNFDYIDLKNNSGTVVESTRPFIVDINGPNGWMD